MRDSDTIVALSSGNLPSGVAVIRLSGPQVSDIIRDFSGGLPEPRMMALREIGGPDGVLDRGLVVYFPGPASFTGEDCAELHVHGSPAVVRAVLDRLCQRDGVRLADAGEFTRRAFENGKLDLTQIEGLGDLLAAETEGQRQLALGRAAGQMTAKIADWRGALIDLRAEIEARLDFSDEGDVADELPESWVRQLHAVRRSMREALEGYAQGRVVREGFRVALAGPPNVGKSSLLNALARSDLAIVSAEAGTTRDVREVPLDMAGQLVIFVDMAGLRETASDAEAQGVARAQREIAQADLVLWLAAPDVPEMADFPVPDGVVLWRVASKADLREQPGTESFTVSAKTGAGLEALMQAISYRAFEAGSGGGSVLISHARDRQALDAALVELEQVDGLLAQPELAAERLRQAADVLARLTGHIDAEMVLDRLFSNFCIGK